MLVLNSDPRNTVSFTLTNDQPELSATALCVVVKAGLNHCQDTLDSVKASVTENEVQLSEIKQQQSEMSKELEAFVAEVRELAAGSRARLLESRATYLRLFAMTDETDEDYEEMKEYIASWAAEDAEDDELN